MSVLRKIWGFIKQVPWWAWLAVVAVGAAMGWRAAARRLEAARQRGDSAERSIDVEEAARRETADATEVHVVEAERIRDEATVDVEEIEAERPKVEADPVSEANELFGND